MAFSAFSLTEEVSSSPPSIVDSSSSGSSGGNSYVLSFASSLSEYEFITSISSASNFGRRKTSAIVGKWYFCLVEYLLDPLSSHLKNRSLQSLSVHWKYLLPTCD